MKSGDREKGKPARQSRAQRARSAKPTSMRRSSPTPASSSSIQPEDVSLTRMLETLKPHDHLCLIYESQEEWRAAVVPFISIGLKHGEKCCYFADAHTAEQLHGYLQAEGVDVASTEASGQLVILCESEAYTKEGSFDPDLMISLLITETEKAIAEGYPALRLTGEMTWVLHGLPGSERLLEYEAKLNRDFYPKYPALGICQYDRWKFDSEVIKGIIMTHPLLVRGNNIYRNFYYIPPEEFLNRKRAETEVQHWLNNVERERRIQEALRRSELEKTTILATMAELVTYQDLEYRVVWANRAAADSVGLTPEDLIGRYCYEIWQQRSLPCVNCPVVPARETGKPQETETSSPDGRFWLVRSYPVIDPDGVVSGVIEVTQDITERKRAEEVLRSSEERFRLLYEGAPLAYQSLDADGCFIDVNQAWLNTMGYSREEVIGRWFGDFLAPHEVEAFKKRFPEFKARGEVQADIKVVRKNGSHAIMAITGKIGYDAHGHFKQTHCILVDITERKKVDEELKKTMAELERSNVELERFAYVASHDLQEPLRMVSSYVQLLERRYKDKLDADANDFINYAMGGAKRMEELLSDLLVYSRVGTSAKPFKRTDMEAVLEAALANLQVAIKESKARVSHDPLPKVMADGGQLVQVFQNLISNAVKFRGEKSPRIHVSAEHRDSEWVFSVKDNGIGIEPQDFDRVFLIFQRLYREEYPGTGTGLAIAKKIIERHGGRMWVESQPGKGSTFYFSIKATGKRQQA